MEGVSAERGRDCDVGGFQAWIEGQKEVCVRPYGVGRRSRSSSMKVCQSAGGSKVTCVIGVIKVDFSREIVLFIYAFIEICDLWIRRNWK